MKPRRLKKFILASISALLVAIPPNISDACGWSDEDYVPYAVVFNKDFFAPKESHFDFFSEVLFNFGKEGDDHTRNVEEWKDFLRGLDTAATRKLVYETSEKELAGLQKRLEDKNYSDELAQTMSRTEWQNIVPYLRFVRKCQPYVNEFGDWA